MFRVMRGLRTVLDFLFPPRCLACGARTLAPSFCAACAASITSPASPLCVVCGLPFTAPGDDHRCGACLNRPPRFARARACAIYRRSAEARSPIAVALHNYKYGRDVTLGRWLGELFADRCPLIVDHDVIVPVPLHLERLRWRGFNQALLLARPLARRHRLPLHPFAIARTRATVPQVGLNEADRRRNLVGAFTIRDRAAVRGRKILLVDDVYTTGATVDECARALRRAHATKVDVLVLARAVLD